LEFTASVAVIAASVAVVASVVVKRRADAMQVETAQTPSMPPVPRALQSLGGASVIGNASAGIAIIQYSDFECPFCASFARETWPQIQKQYIDQGKVLSAYRHLPQRASASAAAAARGAYCAGQQQRFWQMHDALFQRRELTERASYELASQLHLDIRKFDDCLLRDGQEHVQQDIRSAVALRIDGTPTFLIGRVGRNKTVVVTHIVSGAQPFDTFRRVFDALLDDEQKRRPLGL
jgi:protein-disulfide isomerase